MISNLTKALIGYYAALRISAGALSLWLPFEARTDPSPIVRTSAMISADGFDLREVVQAAGMRHVVTLPAGPEDLANRFRQHPILPN